MTSSPSIEVERLAPARVPLRIAVVTETWPPDINGVANTLSRIVSGLQALGHQIWLVRPRQTPDESPAPRDRFEETLVGGLPIPFYRQLRMGLPARKDLTRLWVRERPDIVHIATEGPLGWSALKAARKLKLPISTDFRTNFHAYSQHYGIGWLRGAIMSYMKRFHNGADCTMVPTARLQGELAALGFERLQVVPRGVDTELFTPDRRDRSLRAGWGASDHTLVLLCVSRLAPEKNLALVIKAWQAMKEKRPDTKLVLVGDGPQREALAALDPDIVFAGFRSGDDLARHYASADLFAFASLTETFGNVTLEALASGLAVVAYAHAAAGELITEGRNGIIAPADDSAAFVRAVIELGLDDSRRLAAGRAARNSALDLEWSAIYRRTEQIMRMLVDAAARPN
jgi:glycosyltransferase involved in cell wall biosynthesis